MRNLGKQKGFFSVIGQLKNVHLGTKLCFQRCLWAKLCQVWVGAIEPSFVQSKHKLDLPIWLLFIKIIKYYLYVNILYFIIQFRIKIYNLLIIIIQSSQVGHGPNIPCKRATKGGQACVLGWVARSLDTSFYFHLLI